MLCSGLLLKLIKSELKISIMSLASIVWAIFWVKYIGNQNQQKTNPSDILEILQRGF